MQRRFDAVILVDSHARNAAYLQREVGRLRANPAPTSNVWLNQFLDPAVYPSIRRSALQRNAPRTGQRPFKFGGDLDGDLDRPACERKLEAIASPVQEYRPGRDGWL